MQGQDPVNFDIDDFDPVEIRASASTLDEFVASMRKQSWAAKGTGWDINLIVSDKWSIVQGQVDSCLQACCRNVLPHTTQRSVCTWMSLDTWHVAETVPWTLYCRSPMQPSQNWTARLSNSPLQVQLQLLTTCIAKVKRGTIAQHFGVTTFSVFATEGAVLKTCSKGKVDKLTCAAGSSMCNRRKGNSKHVSHFLDELKVLEFMWMQKRLPKLPMQQGSLWYKRYTASKSAEHAIATSYANWGCKSCCSPQWVQWYASPYGVNLRCFTRD